MDLIAARRYLHTIPERAYDLPKTAAYIKEQLDKLNCTVTEIFPCAYGAFFDFGKEETVAFRADMDALPVEERTGLSFASEHPGMMHACGHDGHMAMLLGLANWVNQQDDLPRNVLLLFQPAEETGGGAKPICDSGILQKYHVVRCFGQHIWPEVSLGKIATRPGPLMSRVTEVDIVITGRSSHVGKAALGLDAMNAACKVHQRAWELEKNMPEDVARLLKFGALQAGTARNIVAGSAILSGTIRAYEDKWFFYMLRETERICREVEEETGCTVEMKHTEGYPAIWNDEALTELVLSVAPVERLEAPSMISEDFSYYGKQVPSTFFFLGCGPCPALHMNDFTFDESILETGCSLFQTLAKLK